MFYYNSIIHGRKHITPLCTVVNLKYLGHLDPTDHTEFSESESALDNPLYLFRELIQVILRIKKKTFRVKTCLSQVSC